MPNSTPIVADVVSHTTRLVGIVGHSRPRIQAATATLIAMSGFSGPRLTPAPSASATTSASDGSDLSGIGGPTSPAVAGSGPPCPGSFHTSTPTSSPIPVSTAKIHHRA
ncbi:hypothetical protein A5N73_04270 [Prescottella equi]|nr:hypothetical protein A5N73_04270 [Prescottella equi]